MIGGVCSMDTNCDNDSSSYFHNGNESSVRGLEQFTIDHPIPKVSICLVAHNNKHYTFRPTFQFLNDLCVCLWQSVNLNQIKLQVIIAIKLNKLLNMFKQ